MVVSNPHMLAYALATQMVAPPTNPWTGVSFPLWESDFCGPTCYSGSVTFGLTIDIPSAVNLITLGLTGERPSCCEGTLKLRSDHD